MASVNPPLVADPIALAWQCERRLHCCGRWEVSVSSLELERMRRALAAGWPTSAVLDEAGPVRAEDPPPRWVLPKAGASCALLEEGLCGYRVRFGAETQPRACQTFPYLSLMAPTRHLLGLDFTCPTALRLLAEADAVSPIDHGDRPAPLAFVRDLRGGPDDAGWAAQHALFDALQAATGHPFCGLYEAIAAVIGLPPAAPLEGVDWSSEGVPGALFGPLLRSGSDPLEAMPLFGPSEEDVDLSDLPAVIDEPALLGRYLAHRLLVPAHLRKPPSPAGLSAAMATAAVRWYIERARGATPLAAVRRTDLWLMHRPHVTQVEMPASLVLLGLLPRRVNGFPAAPTG